MVSPTSYVRVLEFRVNDGDLSFVISCGVNLIVQDVLVKDKVLVLA